MTNASGVHDTSPRRAAILSAALDCFTEAGYAAATVDEIRRSAGASVGSMYHHFGGKEQLAAALLTDTKQAYYGAWLASLPPHRSPRQGIRAGVGAHFDWVAANPKLARFLFGFEEPAVIDAAATQIRSIRADFQAHLLTWLRPHVQNRRIRHLPDDVYEPLWMAPAQSFTRQWLAWDNLADLARFCRHFADAAWSSLQTP